MRAQIEKKQPGPDKKMVLTKSIQRLSVELGLSRQELSSILGRSEATLSRFFNTTQSKTTINKSRYLDPSSKEGELAILLLRAYKNLDILFGGNALHCQSWLRNHNHHLNGKPIDLIKSIQGLIKVVQYLDAMQG